MTEFQKKILDVVKKIPKGRTMTYKQVAILAGSPHAFRAVGLLMKKNYDPAVPCHRVIKSDGTLGDYNRGGTEMKKKMLEEEKGS
jgi:methylated-DNA-[protein]-cysteine S-methyltransferase